MGRSCSDAWKALTSWMLRALGAGRCSGWARLAREVREREVFARKLDLRELAFARELGARELVVFEADAAGAFFFAAGVGVSPMPLRAARVPAGSRQRRQSSEKTKRRDIDGTSGARPADTSAAG